MLPPLLAPDQVTLLCTQALFLAHIQGHLGPALQALPAVPVAVKGAHRCV